MDLVVRMKFGAHLYGTATEQSDIDYRGVFLPSREEILLGTIPKCRSHSTGDNATKNTARDVDEEIYSLHHFIDQGCRGEVAAMDMLHAPPDAWTHTSEIWREIVRRRDRFYSKRLDTFLIYARRQTGKYGIKGSRLHAAAKVIKLLKEKNPKQRLQQVWDELPQTEYCSEIETAPNGLRQYQVCGKVFQESVAIGHVVPILQKFYDAYGQRAKLAAENKEIDWKAVSHALRAAIQTREILVEGTIRYPLRDAPFLIEVKQGRLDYTREVAPALEKLLDGVALLIEKSDLPDMPDRDFWDRFICNTVEGQRFGAQHG